MGLLSSPIKIRGKPVKGSMSYDRTNKQSNRNYNFIYINIFINVSLPPILDIFNIFECRILKLYYDIIKKYKDKRFKLFLQKGGEGYNLYYFNV